MVIAGSRNWHSQHESINLSLLVSTVPAAGGDAWGVFVAEHSRVLEPIKHYSNATAYLNIEGLH